MTYKMQKIKEHFEEEAKEFDSIILKLIPYYDKMMEALVLSVPFEKDSKINVIDLGCGTGTVALHIKRAFPNAVITCLDLSENMINMAKTKLSAYEDVKYIVNDFYGFNFVEKYDVIVSSLALHHLVNDSDKKIFYEKIYKALNSSGIFYNADVVLGSNDKMSDMYIRKWKEYMSKNVTIDEIENKWLPKYREEDTPAKMTDHLAWMNEIGFKDVDVVWKYYNYAVYGGMK